MTLAIDGQDEIARIYREYHPRILRYLGNLAGENDAPDLAQVVFLKVSRSLDNFRGDSSLSTWIYRIATNTAMDHATSSQAKQKRSEERFEEGNSSDEISGTRIPGTEREYIRKEMSACIRGVVDRLPEAYRTVLLLGEFEGFSNSEIAGMLDIRLHTVKIRLHRARAALRKALDSECSLYRDESNVLMCDRKTGGNAHTGVSVSTP